MTPAYSELYLPDAKTRLATFADYGINQCGIDPDELFTLFNITGVAYQFSIGNPAYVAGKSGFEIMREVKEKAYGYDRLSLPDPKRYQEKSPQYWAGWSLAHYQWSSARGFAAILQHVSFSDIVDMYGVFHEMDVERFIEEMDRRIAAADGPCNLKRQRENAGLSQSELARLSGVGLRSIQMYEQRVNDINRAQAQTVLRLARAIGCSTEDLLE